MPEGSTAKSVMISEHMSDVSQVLDSIIVSEKKSQVIVVSHSFGGIIVQKLLEDKDTRAKLKAAVLMCSVPPSGNGPMTGRFVKKNLWNALKIVYGFVLKKAASNKSISRELFFGDITAVSDEKLDE
jgi:alpha-beta hydrolase superfamily lysophospholipase